MANSDSPAPTNETSSIIATARRFLESIPRKKRLLVAFSGGPDSTALLEVLYRIAPDFNLTLFACWVNHALRDSVELADERCFVEAFCLQRAIPLAIFEAKPGELEKAGKLALDGGLESAARDFRYRCLEKARAENACEAIVLAHTADDVSETLVMRFMTGSGTGGLRGIAPVTDVLMRPFLGVTKIEILAFLEANTIAYRIDSTNEQQDFLRNKVRHSIMPALKTVFPYFGSALSTGARKASLDDDALTDYAKALLVPVLLPPDSPVASFRIPIDAYALSPIAVRIRALYLLARSFSNRIPWKIMYNAASNNNFAGVVAEGAGISIYSDRGSLWVRSLELDGNGASYNFIAGTFGNYTIGKELKFGLYCDSGTVKDGMSSIRADSFSWPLEFRTATASDFLATRSGCRSVLEILSDLKIARAQRNLVPVIEDASGIVAVLGRLCGSRDVFRYNGEIEHCESPSFLSVELKGAVSNDGI